MSNKKNQLNYQSSVTKKVDRFSKIYDIIYQAILSHNQIALFNTTSPDGFFLVSPQVLSVKIDYIPCNFPTLFNQESFEYVSKVEGRS